MPSIRFGEFELDTRTFELRQNGRAIKIQQQPARVLALLAGNPGMLVTRNQLRSSVWGNETFVDFEQGLNFCIRQIRIALKDQADRPAFVETLPRLGYRFIAPIQERDAANHDAGGNRIRIAVLPFENQEASTDDYFAAALTESMIAQLSRIDPARLRIVAAPKTREAEGSPGFEALKQSLHLDYLLQGWVHRADANVWIAVRLHDLNDRSVLWSETYDRKGEDLPAIQKEVALKVSHSLALELFPGAAVGSRKYSRTPAAYDAYLKGRFFWHKMTGESMRAGIKYFSEALSIDPNFAPAYAGLADCYAQMGSIRVATMKPLEALAKAKPLLQRAFDLDDTLIEAHCTLALLKSWYEHDWIGAEREFRLALSLEPGNIAALLWQSLFLAAIGRQEEAVESTRKARESEPFSPLVNTYVGAALIHSARYDEAVSELRQAIEFDPNYYRSYLFLGLALGWQERFPEAVRAFDRTLALNPENLEALAYRGVALASQGDREGAEHALSLLEATRDRFEPAVLIACIYAGLQEESQMFEWLQVSLERKSGPLYITRLLWAFTRYRAGPRMRSFFASIGLPP